MLTEQEKVRARAHLGYLQVASAQTFVLGIPTAQQTQFMVEGAFNRILAEAEPLFRRYLDILDSVETQLLDNTENLAVTKLGEIEINPKEFEGLLRRYRYWRSSLANLMGIVPNPHDQRFNGTLAGGINVPVLNG